MSMLPLLDDARIIDDLRRALGDDLIAVYRFGSSARGEARTDSDCDLAVLCRTPLARLARFDLQEHLAAALGRDVDLVDLSTASPVLAVQAVFHGRLLAETDAAARGAFEDRVLSSYARLNEERRGILERVVAEGTVHGR